MDGMSGGSPFFNPQDEPLARESFCAGLMTPWSHWMAATMFFKSTSRPSLKGLFTGGVKLPMALAELGLIDEYEFVVEPRLAGHGPDVQPGATKGSFI